MNIFLLLMILPMQFSAYTEVPYPNCLENTGNEVILHSVGSCGQGPTDENMRYYADRNYHVKSVNITGNDHAVTLVNTTEPNTYDQMFAEFECAIGAETPSRPEFSCQTLRP